MVLQADLYLGEHHLVISIGFVSPDTAPFEPKKSYEAALVGGLKLPLPKNVKVTWDDDIPNKWENRKCSKPPTSARLKRSEDMI